MVAHCLVLLILDQDVLWKLSVFPIFASYWKSMAFKDSLYMWNLGLPCKLNSQGLMNHLWTLLHFVLNQNYNKILKLIGYH